ncbi:MAG TPA: hypothetical protein VFR56_06015 [Actinomycetes bacterium]|nr:hypothetical protein [Actinomycetes bacterium]
MRIRLLLVTAAVSALSMVAASPASAAVTHSEAVGALLTVNEIGGRWHKVPVSEGMTGMLHGCNTYTTKGLDAKAARAFQFRQQDTWITERLKSFDGVKLAGREVAKWVARYGSCDSFEHDGQTFTISKAKVGGFADATAAFKIKGIVTDADGIESPVTAILVGAKFGHHVVSATTVVIGGLTSEQVTDLRKSTIRVAKVGVEKVDIKLGR